MLGGPVFLVNTQKLLNDVQIILPNKQNDNNVNIWEEKNFKKKKYCWLLENYFIY